MKYINTVSQGLKRNQIIITFAANFCSQIYEVSCLVIFYSTFCLHFSSSTAWHKEFHSTVNQSFAFPILVKLNILWIHLLTIKIWELTCRNHAYPCIWPDMPCTSDPAHCVQTENLHSRGEGPLWSHESAPVVTQSCKWCPALHGSILQLRYASRQSFQPARTQSKIEKWITRKASYIKCKHHRTKDEN